VEVFVQGELYRRLDLHKKYGGQRQGGISTPSRQAFIMLFTGEMGLLYGYKDGWSDDGLFLYTGAGQRGDMAFVRGNRAVRDHIADGKDLHLFEYVRKGYVRYVGQMICTGHHQRRVPDVEGRERQAIIFELSPIHRLAETVMVDKGSDDQGVWAESLSVLRERALASSTYGRTPMERKTLIYSRSEAVRVYVLKRANGTCEGCRESAPFRTSAGRPYLETHHIRRLSDVGPDDPQWVVALCPNCHRRAHYGEDRVQFNLLLGHKAQERESFM
jgi:5-methylcytosine-specific restriction protein A